MRSRGWVGGSPRGGYQMRGGEGGKGGDGGLSNLLSPQGGEGGWKGEGVEGFPGGNTRMKCQKIFVGLQNEPQTGVTSRTEYLGIRLVNINVKYSGDENHIISTVSSQKRTKAMQTFCFFFVHLKFDLLHRKIQGNPSARPPPPRALVERAAYQ